MNQHKHRHQLLFVDDEPRITSAMKAIFRRDYDVLTANSGDEALEILAENDVNVIVSDQRMPKMLGNELLARVSANYPRTMRILLTGFMDKQAIVNSINDGQIYRFINKPWNNEEVRSIVADAAIASESPIVDEADSRQIDTASRPDTKQSAGAAASSATTSNKARLKAMLMVGEKANIRHQIRRFCGQQGIMIYSTQNNEHALAAVASRKNIGVVVMELPEDSEEAIQTIGLLKQARPDLITIALADEYDTETAIDLVNQGQVFKYLAKPLDVEDFQHCIQKAFIQHRFLKLNKNTHARFRVQKRSGSVMEHLQQFFGRLTGAPG